MHDLIVVGLGVGGEEVAARVAKAGKKVLAVERKLVGGECPYWGCIPSKMMVRAGNTLAEALRVTGLAGSSEISPQWEPVARRIREEATTDWNDAIAVERHEKRGTTFIRGEARLAGPGAVEIDGARYEASLGVVVATGTAPAVPPIEGIQDVPFWTNREAIEAKEPPRSMIVLGAGAVGLELGQVYARFGTRVTMIEINEHVLALDEPENGAELDEVMRAEGIDLHTSSVAKVVRRKGDDIEVELEDGSTLRAERLLVATGRKSNLAGLGLDSVGLDPSSATLDVDGHMRAGEKLWAVGDITGKGLFTHVAVYQGRIAAADILGEEHRVADYSAVPRVTFTDPEVASVGMTEKQARDAGLEVRVAIAPSAQASTRAWIHGSGAARGVLKLVAAGGLLVGGSLMGPGAGEMVGIVSLAIKERIPVDRLLDLILPYPTFLRGLEEPLRQLR